MRPGNDSRGTSNVLGGGEEATIRAVAKVLEVISSREVQLELSPAVPGDVARTCADTGRITARLGWVRVPRTALRVGLGAQWQFALATDRAA